MFALTNNDGDNTIAYILLLTIAAGAVIFIGAHCIYVGLTTTKRRTRTLQGKHVLITGGSSGIGKAVAIQCAKLGANVTIAARNTNTLDTARKDIEQFTKNDEQFIRGLQLDVGNSDACMESLNTLDTTNPVYMLINCAGLAICGTLDNLTTDSINKMLTVNLIGTINTTKALIPAMKTRQTGIIVNVSSQGGLIGIYGYTVYAASKFAIRGFSEALDMEVRPHGIYVTVALPPDTDTPGFAIENQSKPAETRLISEAAGVEQPQIVAERLIADALAGRFFSHVGFESYMVTNVCAGFAPAHSLATVYWQAFILGPLRIVSSIVSNHFQSIVHKCHIEKKRRR